MCWIFLWLSLLSSSPLVLAQGHVTDYAPYPNIQCPTEDLLRVFTPQNQSLNPLESAYINARESTVISAAWEAWLGDGSAIGYNLSAFAGNYPRIGMALCGGGLRAAQYGAGALSGLDARNESATAAGTGGLLQVSSYIAGLSGGSWLTGSLYMNGWPTLHDLVFGNDDDLSGWFLDLDLAAPGGVDVFDASNQAFYGSLIWSIEAKANKSIDTSITDLWGRAISYHFLNETTLANFFNNDTAHGAGQLWSQLTQTAMYQQFQVPFPIIHANSRPVGSDDTGFLSLNSTVYELSPLEFGSWDPDLSAMTNMTYVGTHLTNGQPPNNTGCVTGFDEVGFLMGTSASLFNQIIDSATDTLEGLSSGDRNAIIYSLTWQLREVRTRANDVANWPNPFNGIKSTTFQDSNSTWLELVDGSTNQENLPLTPLLVNAREVDVIVAIDASADDPYLWVNGSAFTLTTERVSTLLEASHQAFPPIPASTELFVEAGLGMRPAFFGCDPTQNPPEFPLVINLPNAPPIDGSDPVTNTPTFQLQYTPLHSRIFFDQAHNTTINGFTPYANTPDPNWGGCLQCAAIDRSRYKITPSPPRSSFCSQCFLQYCYDPQNPPSSAELPNRHLQFVDPDPVGLDQLEDFLDYSRYKLMGGFIGLFMFMFMSGFGLAWWKWRKDEMGVERGYWFPKPITFIRYQLERMKRKERRKYKRMYDLHDDDLTWAYQVGSESGYDVK